MHKRPRRWASLDAEFLARPRITALREEFGAAGPLLFLAVVLEVERTESGRGSDGVEARYGEFGRLVGVSASRSRAIIERAASLGLVAIQREQGAVTGRESDRLTLLKRPRWAPRMGPSAVGSGQPRRVPTDERVIAALVAADRPLRGAEIAERLGLVCGGSFRTRLARLVNCGEIVRRPGGYVGRK